jgi:hypothetical protein
MTFWRMAWYRHRQITKEGPSMRCHSPVARWRLIVCQSNSSERSAQTTWRGCIASCLLRYMACSPVGSTIHVILDLCLSVQLVAYSVSNFAGFAGCCRFPPGGGPIHQPGWPHRPSLPLHLRQRRLHLGQPEGHGHSTVERASGGEFGVGLLPLAGRGIQRAKAQVTMGLERAHAECVG